MLTLSEYNWDLLRKETLIDLARYYSYVNIVFQYLIKLLHCGTAYFSKVLDYIVVIIT